MGGFSASPYLKSELSARLHAEGIAINNPDGQTYVSGLENVRNVDELVPSA